MCRRIRIQQLVPELAVEALVVVILPRAALLDEQGLHIEPAEPFVYCPGGELGAGDPLAATPYPASARHTRGGIGNSSPPKRKSNGEPRQSSLHEPLEPQPHEKIEDLFNRIMLPRHLPLTSSKDPDAQISNFAADAD